MQKKIYMLLLPVLLGLVMAFFIPVQGQCASHGSSYIISKTDPSDNFMLKHYGGNNYDQSFFTNGLMSYMPIINGWGLFFLFIAVILWGFSQNENRKAGFSMIIKAIIAVMVLGNLGSGYLAQNIGVIAGWFD